SRQLGKSYIKTPFHQRTSHPTNPKLKHGPASENGGSVSDDVYVDGHNAQRALTMLQRFSKGDQPFFLAVGFVKPHLPFCAPDKYWKLYDRSKIKIPPREKMKDSLPWARSNWGELKNYPDIPRDQEFLDDATTRRLIHGYYAATSYMDAQVGKLLQALETLGLAKNTIIVLWGDHGWYVGDYGEWCKHSNYEIAARVPLIVHVPETLRDDCSPGHSARMAELLDIYPTLCDLTGLSVPDHLHGHSLVPLLQDPNRSWRPAAISQYVKNEPIAYRNKSGKMVRRNSSNLGTSVRTSRFRFTRWARRSDGEIRGEELVDFQNDPDSMVNVINDPDYRMVLPHLRALADQSATGTSPP
ncbi:MAG: sulfatase-like hydrolase/transferase, partial [Planctomycetota bacterium]